MKLLIAILSCHKHRALEQAQRDTWIKDIPAGVDYRFFLGNPFLDAEADEVFLDVPDDYEGLPYKTNGLVRWAIERDYDFLFKCDIDTLVSVGNLLGSDFASYDFVGGNNDRFASGGSGYWISRKAMDFILGEQPRCGAEDVFVANILCYDHDIKLHADARYKFYPGDTIKPDILTFHISSCDGTLKAPKPYTAEQMYLCYRRMKELQR